jgi:hypothetical protein
MHKKTKAHTSMQAIQLSSKTISFLNIFLAFYYLLENNSSRQSIFKN